jgi:hypothetical protein
VKEPTTAASNGPVFLDADAILATNDTREEDVWVPEWKSHVRMRGLTGSQRDAYEASITVGKGPNQTINARNARAKLVVLCAIKPDGSPLFKTDQVAALGAKSASAVQRLFDSARKLSGLTDEDMDELTEAFGDAQSATSMSS